MPNLMRIRRQARFTKNVRMKKWIVKRTKNYSYTFFRKQSRREFITRIVKWRLVRIFRQYLRTRFTRVFRKCIRRVNSWNACETSVTHTITRANSAPSCALQLWRRVRAYSKGLTIVIAYDISTNHAAITVLFSYQNLLIIISSLFSENTPSLRFSVSSKSLNRKFTVAAYFGKFVPREFGLLQFKIKKINKLFAHTIGVDLW